MNPSGQVPTLVLQDLAQGGKEVLLTQSLAIIEFLDETFPQARPIISY